MTAGAGLRFISLFIGSLIAAGVVVPAFGQTSSGADGLLNDKWVFNLGAFVLGTDVRAGLNGQSSTNPDVNFDETFGTADDATRVRADVLWRITPAHRMRFLYFDNSQTRSRVLAEDVKWGDYTFKKDSRADFTIGVGLGYNLFSTNLDVTKTDFNGHVEVGYSGLQAYLTGSF